MLPRRRRALDRTTSSTTPSHMPTCVSVRSNSSSSPSPNPPTSSTIGGRQPERVDQPIREEQPERPAAGVLLERAHERVAARRPAAGATIAGSASEASTAPRIRTVGRPAVAAHAGRQPQRRPAPTSQSGVRNAVQPSSSVSQCWTGPVAQPDGNATASAADPTRDQAQHGGDVEQHAAVADHAVTRREGARTARSRRRGADVRGGCVRLRVREAATARTSSTGTARRRPGPRQSPP